MSGHRASRASTGVLDRGSSVDRPLSDKAIMTSSSKPDSSSAALPPCWKLISWNTAHRRKKIAAQVAALEQSHPDVVALQEVTIGNLPHLQAALREAGFVACVSTVAAGSGPRRYGCLIASRHSLEPISPLPLPWPEKTCSARLRLPSGSVDIYTVHIPPGSTNGWVKIEAFEAVYTGLTGRGDRPRVLCGDFNSPKEELADGTVVTWAESVRPDGTVRCRKRIRGGEGARWDAGERNVIAGFGPLGMRDVYRQLHGYESSAYSWVLRRGEKTVRRRFDHIFASQELRATSCEYVHDWRRAELSDHSAIEACFER